MKELFNRIISYKKQILIFSLSLLVMFMTITAVIVETRAELLKTKADHYISKVVSNGKGDQASFRILKDSHTWYVNDKLQITNQKDNLMIALTTIDNIIIDTDFEIFVKTKGYLIVDDNIKDILYRLTEYAIGFTFFLIVIFLSLIHNTSKNERDATLRILMSNEALSSNKTTIMITENVHHELNTPMEVIVNKMAKIKEYMMPVLLNNELFSREGALELNDDFELIEESTELIHNVLNSMKEYKHLRYSNGNKTLYDIINGAFSVLNYTAGNFKYSVDVRLKLYKLDDVSFKNATLVHIILNHLKNSLSANSENIIVLFDNFDKKDCYFRIIDNGNGIEKKHLDNIFKANFSTKDIPGEISGNGLYLNRSILREHKGDVKLIDTSLQGTTFGLFVPAKPH